MSDVAIQPPEEKKKRRLTLKGASKLLGRVMGTASRDSDKSSKTQSDEGGASPESKDDDVRHSTSNGNGNSKMRSSSTISTSSAHNSGQFQGSTLQEIADEQVELDDIGPIRRQQQGEGSSQSQDDHSNKNAMNAGGRPNSVNALSENKGSSGSAHHMGRGFGEEHEWSTEKMILQKEHAKERAILIEENISLKRMLDGYDKASGGQLNFKATYDEMSHMRAKVSILETELVNTHVVVEKLQRDVELLHSRLMIEREEKGHLEQYYREKIHQYVEYLESKHFVSRENMSAEIGAAAVLSIDDFLRLSAESDPLALHANLASNINSSRSSTSRGRKDRERESNSHNEEGSSARSRSDSPFGHRGWRTMEQELTMHATNDARRKKKKDKVEGPTTNLIIMAEKFDSSSKAEHKFKVTHKSTSPELKLSQPSLVTPRNILQSPPSLKQTISGPKEDYVRPVGRGRNCAVHEPEYGTVFVEPNHQLENCGLGKDVNAKLVKKYEKMGHWASFTSSAKFKLKPAMEPIIGSRGLDDGPFFKLK